MNNIKNNKKGFLILLAFVMTSVVLASALIMSTLAIRESRLAQLSDKGLTALYGSETVSEETIYQIIHNSADILTLDGTSQTLSNGVTWNRTATETSNSFRFDFIPPGQVEVVNLYNTANPNASPQINSVSFSWSSGTELTVQYYEWDGFSLTIGQSRIYTCTGSPCSATEAVNSANAHALEITVTGTAVTDLLITGSPSANSFEIPITIQVQGEYRGSKQAVQLILPKPAPWEGGAPPAVIYDLNGDGLIDNTDVNILVDVVGGVISCPVTTCDLNGDGGVNILDIQLLINQIP